MRALIMPVRLLSWISLMILFSLISACSGQKTIPDSKTSVVDVYQSVWSQTAEKQIRVVVPESSIQSGSLLPNPQLIMTVHEHLAGDVLVPTYQTSIFLYEKNHRALPGELVPE